MGVHETKTFKSGNSEAVRIPKELAFGLDVPVTLERTGDTLVIRPTLDAEQEARELDRFLDEMLAIGTPPDGPQPRPQFEWIDRDRL